MQTDCHFCGSAVYRAHQQISMVVQSRNRLGPFTCCNSCAPLVEAILAKTDFRPKQESLTLKEVPQRRLVDIDCEIEAFEVIKQKGSWVHQEGILDRIIARLRAEREEFPKNTTSQTKLL